MTPKVPRDDVLLRRLADNSDESATAALFLHLYRLSPELRHWLREDYARDAKLRAKLDRGAIRRALPSVVRFADLTDDNGAWREEQRRHAHCHANYERDQRSADSVVHHVVLP